MNGMNKNSKPLKAMQPAVTNEIQQAENNGLRLRTIIPSAWAVMEMFISF